MPSINVKQSFSIPEAFDEVRKQETVNEKARKLKEFDGTGMRWFVDALFNRDFTFVGKVDYKPLQNPRDMQYAKIQTSIKRLEALQEHKNKPEVVYRNAVLVLEVVSPAEAELIMKLFTGDRKIEGINKAVFKKAYPEFFRTEGTDAQDQNRAEASA